MLYEFPVDAAPQKEGSAGVPEIVPADRGRPACSRSGLKWRLTMFWASSGVPLPDANKSPLSCHSELAQRYASVSAVFQTFFGLSVRADERRASGLRCARPENQLGRQTLDARSVARGLQGELRGSHAHLHERQTYRR
jgi:hypothetical protein